MTNPERFRKDANDHEFITNPETKEITDDELVESLREGIENPEVKNILGKWCEQEESKIDIKGLATADSKLRFNVRRNLIYEQAGYIEEAIESLHQDLELAEDLGLPHLADEIEVEIRRINNNRN